MATISKRRGRYVVDFYDQAGMRQRITMPEGSRKKDAKDKLTEMEELVRQGAFRPGKKIPLFSEVAEEWIEYKKPKLRETTWEVYEGHVRNHFDELNNRKITTITIATVEKFITARQTEGMNIGTIRKVLVTFGQILAYAVRHRYIPYNPLRDAERPRDPGETHKEVVVLAPEQIQALLENTENLKYKTLFTLACMSGARQGELLGLKWDDVDWDAGQIHIQRTYTKGRFLPTKTRTSNRRVDLGPTVLTELKKWRLACPNNDLDLIFPNEAGEPMNYSNMMQRYFFPALESAELPRIRFHDLRHGYASLLIEQGENIKYIQTQLGHSSPTVTLNVYAHLMKGQNQEAARRLEDTVFSNRSQSGHNGVSENEKGVEGFPPTP